MLETLTTDMTKTMTERTKTLSTAGEIPADDQEVREAQLLGLIVLVPED